MSSGVHIWWVALSVVGVLNIVAWSVSARLLPRRRHVWSEATYRRRRWLVWLSAGYVFGCAFRSFLPRIDLERICLVDTWLSSMAMGRSVATVAELCFIAQCALLLYFAGKGGESRFAMTVAKLLVPLIAVAEVASWYAILSTNYLGHVVENSLWTVSVVMMLVSFAILLPGANHPRRHFLSAVAVFALGYIAFMVTIDVPMYWSRWQANLAEGISYLTLLEGWREASQACRVSFEWGIWREEIPWMTLYFTAAVWLSIALPHAPRWVDGAPNARH